MVNNVRTANEDNFDSKKFHLKIFDASDFYHFHNWVLHCCVLFQAINYNMFIRTLGKTAQCL